MCFSVYPVHLGRCAQVLLVDIWCIHLTQGVDTVYLVFTLYARGIHSGQKAVTLWLDQSLLARIDERIQGDLSSLPGATLSRQALIKAAIEGGSSSLH